jgi:hypothetical protein
VEVQIQFHFNKNNPRHIKLSRCLTGGWERGVPFTSSFNAQLDDDTRKWKKQLSDDMYINVIHINIILLGDEGMIFGHKRAVGGRRKLHVEELHNLYASPVLLV